jgi:hypothetical protein
MGRSDVKWFGGVWYVVLFSDRIVRILKIEQRSTGSFGAGLTHYDLTVIGARPSETEFFSTPNGFEDAMVFDPDMAGELQTSLGFHPSGYGLHGFTRDTLGRHVYRWSRGNSSE